MATEHLKCEQSELNCKYKINTRFLKSGTKKGTENMSSTIFYCYTQNYSLTTLG